MAKWTFPPLPQRSVFVGSPSDMDYLREGAKLEFLRLRNEVADIRGVELYLWEDESFHRGFDHNKPYQASIPLTSDPDCLGAMFLFGERIGSPLPFDFPTDAVSESPALDAHTGHRLHHPWTGPPDTAFPMTGSTFEYLVAVAAGTPVLVLFVGDSSIEEDKPVLNQIWGRKKFRKRKEKEYGEDMGDYVDWLQSECRPQLSQLRNFHRYITRDCNTPVQIVASEEEAREKIRAFLIDKLDLRLHARGASPFKRLAAYDVQDGDVFFGRNTVRDEIVNVLQRRVESPQTEGRPFFCIYGASGAGKSSLLRAGVVAHLCDSVSLGNWTNHVARPGDLAAVAESAGESDPLVPLYADCLAAIDGNTDLAAAVKDASFVSPERRAEWATRELIGALDQRPGTERKGLWRLVLGIDQFEECLEDLGAPDRAALWDNTISFLDHATRSGRIAVAYSVPEARLPQMGQHALLRDLRIAGAAKVVGFPNETIEEIIDKSFARVEPKLSSGLRRRLLDAIKELTDSLTGEDQGAVLPLLSLALSRIYERWVETTSSKSAVEATETVPDREEDEVSRRRLSTEANIDFEGQTDQAEKKETLLTVDAYGDLAELATIIDREGEAAVGEASKAGGGLFVEEEALSGLLRPLVRLLRRDEIDLKPAPPPPDPGSRALAEALRQHRLVAEVKDGRLRLVHERILRHWKRAAAWMETERRRLKYVSDIESDVESWKDGGRDPSLIADFGKRTIEGAAELLYAWTTTLTPVDSSQALDQDHAELRDFLIAVLEHQSTPTARIAELETGPTHFHVAVAAGAQSLVEQFLTADPDNAQLKREKDQRTALFDAAFMDRVEVLKMLLQAGAPADCVDDEGWLPLHAAATRGRLQAVRALAEATGADAPGGPSRVSALHLAAQNGHESVVRWLLDNGAEIDGGNDGGWTALHFAAAGGHGEVVQTLVDRGADPNAEESNGWTPLHLACHAGHGEAVARLLATDAADPSIQKEDGWSAFHVACRYGDRAMVSQLLAHPRTDPVPPVKAGWSPLQLAIAGGSAAVVAALLSDPRVDRKARTPKGATVLDEAIGADRLDILERLLSDEQVDADWADEKGRTALHRASAKGQVSIVHRLLEGAADPDARTKGDEASPLHVVARYGHKAIAALLLDKDPRVNDARDSRDRNALHIAAKEGQESVAELLLERGADVHAPDGDHWTPLHVAAAYGHAAIAGMVIDRDPEAVDPRDGDARTPLHIAAERGQRAAAELLVHRGADVHARDSTGLTPLHLAAQQGQRKIAELLMGKDADTVRAPDAHAWTPLHLAAQNGHVEVVRLLLAHGADKEAPSQNPPLTPLQAAAEVGQTEVVSKLLEHGADVHAANPAKAPALVLAVKNCQYDAALALLAAGADPHATDTDGETGLSSLFAANWSRRMDTGEAAGEAEAQLAQRFEGLAIALPEHVASSAAGPTGSGPGGGAEAHADGRQADAPGDPTLAAWRQQPRDFEALRAAGQRFLAFASYPWVSADRDLRSQLSGRASPIDGAFAIDPDHTTVDASPLRWYEDCRLLRVYDTSWPRKKLVVYYLVDADGQLFRLNGTSPPLHEVNAGAPLRLSEANVIEYLRFFCFFVRGDEGPFYLLESVHDPVLPRDMDVSVRSVIESTARPAMYRGLNEKQQFLCDAVVCYSNALFTANFAVHPGGMVEMLDDEPIAADLPFRLDIPIA